MTPSGARPQVSVVVPTVDRIALLDRCLDGLAAQKGVSFEVLVVHDGVAAITDLLDRRAGDLPLRAVLSSLRPPAPKRNLGWQTARGEVVAFTDDDCAPQPGWLSAGLSGFTDGVDVVQGSIGPHPDDAGNRGTFARTLEVRQLTETFPTANVFYRRGAIERAGGFDERFGGAAGEDTDLAWRVLEAGGRAAFVPDAAVYHAVHPFGLAEHLRSLPRWADLALVVQRHPGVRRLAHRRWFWKATHPTAVLAAIGLLACPFDRRAALLALPHLVRRIRSDGPIAGPQWALVDLVEVAVMVKGSMRHRTLLL
ncbi:MAG: hypothetical protein QOI98_3105 [Solirubrobacteraceae bacterium]|nr:hypothetical protein [Solirubrobacteraceae bacterium]